MSKGFKLHSVVSIVLLLFLNGCATAPGSAHFMRQDAHSSELYRAVIFGKVKINAGFELYEDRLFMALWRMNSKPDPSNINLRTVQFNNPENKKAHNLEIPFALEVIPGTYDLRSVGLSNGNLPERIRLSPKGDYVDNDESKGYHKIQHQVDVGDGEMLYIGTLSIDIKETMASSFKTHTFKYDFKFEDNFNTDLEIFKDVFPSVFEKYKGNIRKQL